MDRREEILACATELIQTRGFNGFSYQDIADRIGIRKASIHHHFPGKQDLGIAFCSQKIKELEAFRDSLRNLPSARRKLKAYLDKPRQRLETRKMCGINAMQSDCAALSDELRTAVRQLTDMDTGIVTEILREGHRDNEFHLNGSAKIQAEVMVSALKGALQRSLLNNDESYNRVATSLYKMLTSEH